MIGTVTVQREKQVHHCAKGHEWEGNQNVAILVNNNWDHPEYFCFFCYRDLIAAHCARVEDGPLPEPTLCVAEAAK